MNGGREGVGVAPETWTSTATIAQAAARLRAAKRVVTLTHARPDGDAIGSTLAVARAVALRGGEATPIYAGLWSHRFDPLVGKTKTIRIGAAEQIPNLLGGPPHEPDVILVMDTGAWSQLHEARAWLEPRTERAIVIDHHLHGDPGVAPMRVIEGAAAATCQPAAELCRLLLEKPAVSALPRAIAEPLYLGLATDTGWFRHSNVTPAVFRLAAELLEAGADHSALYEGVEQSDEPARLQLMGRAITSLQLRSQGRAAIMALTRKDFEESKATLDDAGGLGDLAMSLATVRVAAVLTELDHAGVKLSLRSKRGLDGSALDVNAVAKQFGGGGHAQASGAKFKATIADAIARVSDALEEALK